MKYSPNLGLHVLHLPCVARYVSPSPPRRQSAIVERVDRPGHRFLLLFMCSTSSPRSRSAPRSSSSLCSPHPSSLPRIPPLLCLARSLLSTLDRHIMLYLFAIWTGNPGNKGALLLSSRPPRAPRPPSPLRHGPDGRGRRRSVTQ